MHVYNLMFDKSKVESNLRAVRRVGAVTQSNLICLSYKGPKKWNSLPVDFQTLISKNEYKTKISVLIDAKRQAALLH